MKIRRDIASIPVRTAAQTWQAIVDLITGNGTADRQQLDAAASVMQSLIADEHPATVPIVVKGAGPRVVIYLLYNEDAMEAGADVDKLGSNPTAGDWRIAAPCDDDDVAWMNKILAARAQRISVHPADQVPVDADDTESAKALEIDWGALGKT
jgi:hypothetical protein